MKNKKTIAQFILLSGLAVALTACGSSKDAYMQSRVPAAGAGGAQTTSLEGYWVGTCGSITAINQIQSYAFVGATYTFYTDQFAADDNDCSNSPISSTQVTGSFTLSSTGGYPSIEFMPSNGQATYSEYNLSGTSLQLITTDQVSGLSAPASGVFTLDNNGN
jgi:hypothetical protein